MLLKVMPYTRDQLVEITGQKRLNFIVSLGRTQADRSRTCASKMKNVQLLPVLKCLRLLSFGITVSCTSVPPTHRGEAFLGSHFK